MQKVVDAFDRMTRSVLLRCKTLARAAHAKFRPLATLAGVSLLVAIGALVPDWAQFLGLKQHAPNMPVTSPARPGDSPSAAAQDLAVDLSCVESNCVSRKGQITLEAQVSGTVPDDKEILLLHYSVGDVAWFVLSPIVPDDDGKWATTKTLGNPKPHERERQFNTCATLLPLADSNNLKVRMGWIGPHELPSNMVKLDCVSPRRPPGD